jgi:hypothetical protein
MRWSARSEGADPAASPRESGASLVEFALILPLLVCLLLGMLTGGIALNKKAAVTSGVREGSRYGATLPIASSSCPSGSQTMTCWLTEVADVTETASEGALDSGEPARQICVAYVYPAGSAADDRTTKLVRSSSGDNVTTGSACFSDGRPSGERRVQVQGSRRGTIEFFFATVNPTLGTTSVTKFEAA